MSIGQYVLVVNGPLQGEGQFGAEGQVPSYLIPQPFSGPHAVSVHSVSAVTKHRFCVCGDVQ